MYVLEGVTPCIQSMQLQAGDIGNDLISLEKFLLNGTLFMLKLGEDSDINYLWSSFGFSSILLVFWILALSIYLAYYALEECLPCFLM